jgi:hypothetical protein
MYLIPQSTLLHLPPLRFHCAGGCCDRAQDCCDFGIGSQISSSTKLDLILTRLDLILTRLDFILTTLDLILTTLDLILLGLISSLQG